MIYEGEFNSKNLKLMIIASRFNSFIVEKLITGSKDSIIRNGGDEENIDITFVPGAFEIPITAKKIAQQKKYDGIICLGCIIRGDTPHFDYIASEVSKGIAQTMLETGTPISFGILTTDTIEQAIDRAGTKSGNKGFDATQSIIEMINLFKKFKK